MKKSLEIEERVFFVFFTLAIAATSACLMFMAIQVISWIARWDGSYIFDIPCSGSQTSGVAALFFFVCAVVIPEVIRFKNRNKRRFRANRRKIKI